MKRLTKHAQLLTAVVVVTAAVLVVGPGYQDSRVRMHSGTLWLTSTATGEATLVDGATAEVAARVPVGEPGSALSVIQHGGDALVLNQETGTLRRIDTATLEVTAPEAVLPAHSPAVLKPGPDVIHGIAVHSGMITPIDPGTLAVEGHSVLLAESLRPDNVLVDGRGRVWTIDEQTGDLVRLDGQERRTRPAAATAGRLAITADQPALVVPERGTAELLSPDTGAVTRSVRTGLRDGDSISVSGSAGRSRLLIANSTRGELVVCTFDTGSCADPVHVGAPGAELGTPVEIDNHAVVPDYSTGQATIVDLDGFRVVAQRQLFDHPTRFELLTRHGIVFFNDPSGNAAGVLSLAGGVRTITKHTDGPAESDVPPKPDRQAQPNPVTKVDHSKRKPSVGVAEQTVQPTPVTPAPAPAPAASIVVKPANRGVIGEEFELTVVVRPAPSAATVRWRFGDGAEATGGTVRHSWQQAGAFAVRAISTFGDGVQAEAETTVIVDPPGAPARITALNVRRPKPVIGESVRFSADTTATPDAWAWTVTRPGRSTPEVTARTAEFVHSFTTAGAYTVALTISAGTRTAQFSHQFTVVRGAVEGWGDNTHGQVTPPPAAASGVIAIEAGGFHSLALKADGSVIAWGRNHRGQVTVPLEATSGVVAIAAGAQYSLALKADGSVIAWGDNSAGQTDVPPAARRDVVAIAAGYLHNLALKKDGSVVAWGFNQHGQLYVPPAAGSGVTAIAAGRMHSMALKADGSVIGGGHDCTDQTPATDAIAVAGGFSLCLVLKKDGSVLGGGADEWDRISIPPAAKSGVIAIDMKYEHGLVLKTDGSVVGFGYENNGEARVPPRYNSGVLAVAAGVWFSLVLVEGLD